MNVKELRAADRPREKLKAKGSAALSDFELLQALIGSGNQQADVSQIAKAAQKILSARGTDISYDELEQVLGLGEAKISELLAAFELSKRYLTPSDLPIIDSIEAAVAQLSDIRDKKQEYFVVLSLDGANRLIAKRIITIGTLTSSLVHPREVFADVITDRAASVIVAHNHPSGRAIPSVADNEVTRRLGDAAELLGIKFIDHIIVTKLSYEVIDMEN